MVASWKYHNRSIAYFKYYFNSTIRNTVAHGRFSLLSDSNGKYKKLALELLFGLNYFADTIFSINELDAMNEYINTTVMDYKSCKQESDIHIFYDCLFSDLDGSRNCLRKSNYKSGVFKSYSPKQILWWIFNPFYESIYKCPAELSALRDLIKSPTFWNYILQKLNEQSGETDEKPIILFDYQATRGGFHAAEYLTGFSGYLHTDGYAGYEKVQNITRCGCWAHLRRYFVEAIPPKPSQNGELSNGEIGRDYCNKLFSIEKSLAELDPEERKIKRLELEKSVLEAFWCWVNKLQLLNGSRLGKAVTYSKLN